MTKKLEGNAWKFGDHIDTDVIVPARFLNVWDKETLATHCFEDVRPEFAGSVKPGDVLLAGENFGCGSSREHAPIAIKAAGISVVIARSFARIFYRSAFNIGLPILESEKAVTLFREGMRLMVDLESGEIRDKTTGTRALAMPVPQFMREIIEAGGLVPYIKARGAF